MKTTLTTAESQRLIELGIDENLASSCELIDVTDESDPNSFLDIEEHRIFSLTDLLAILPKEIDIDGFKLTLAMDWDKGEWYLCYNGHCRMQGNCNAPELIDALFSLLIWAIEHHHLNTDKK